MIAYCLVCNEQVPNRRGCSGSRPNTKYCSRSCWAKSKITVCESNCLECGVTFRPTTTKKSNKFCSQKCYWENMKKEYFGEKCNAWKGGLRKKDYYLRRKFHKYEHKKVLERDNFTCQFCGVVGGDLQVDHIKSWSEFPELRFDINNCRTLCAKCHYKETFGRDMPESVKKWGHNLTLTKR